MLPLSLRLVYALNNATFQVSSLALLSIENTRVSIPAEYLPAYGAISFLPYSLRPLFAWISSTLLNNTKTSEENKNRHDRLLFPAFLLASLSFVGTVFIPSGGIILCFFWGFLRGIAGAWSDFLIGMAVIEFSKLQAQLSLSPSQNDGSTTYAHIVSINTAQSSTAKNIGSFVASIATFAFFARNGTLGETTVNTLLLGTAAIFLFASLVSLKFQFHVGNLLTNLDIQRYATVENAIIEHADDVASGDPTNNMHYTSSSLQEVAPSAKNQSETDQSDNSDSSSSSTLLPQSQETTEPNQKHSRQILEVTTLVAFQILLAVSALQKPLVAAMNQTTWVSLVVTSVFVVIFTIFLGYRYERKAKMKDTPGTSSNEEDVKLFFQSHKLPHRQLNLYFLLRYSLPIAGFLMYSYLYSVFEKEPMFLQLLSVLKTAVGSLATFCYEKFLSPYCHSGWPLIGLIASLDIIMGFIALLDVWVIRSVKEKEIDGEYFVDNSLRVLVIAAGLAKYFFAELDYMPALVLSTTNVYTDNEVYFEYRNDGESSEPRNHIRIGQQSERETPPSNGLSLSTISSFNIEFSNEDDSEISSPQTGSSYQKLPIISAGMQYASFLSCIDFGAQIGDWITVPIVASLNITRENHWDNLDRLVVICSIFRMTRVVFLWLICPPIRPQLQANNNDNDYSTISGGTNPQNTIDS